MEFLKLLKLFLQPLLGLGWRKGRRWGQGEDISMFRSFGWGVRGGFPFKIIHICQGNLTLWVLVWVKSVFVAGIQFVQQYWTQSKDSTSLSQIIQGQVEFACVSSEIFFILNVMLDFSQLGHILACFFVCLLLLLQLKTNFYY